MVVAGIVLALLNVAALAWVGWTLLQIRDDILSVIHDVVETEVRKQDERLEKRRQRAADSEPDVDQTEDGLVRTIQAGRPLR